MKLSLGLKQNISRTMDEGTQKAKEEVQAQTEIASLQNEEITAPIEPPVITEIPEKSIVESVEKSEIKEKDYMGSVAWPSRKKSHYSMPRCKDDLRKNIKKAYDMGQIPIKHKLYYIGIIKALGGEREGIVITNDIKNALQMSQQGKTSAQSALNIYGYIETSLVNGMPQFGTKVKLLKDPKEVLGDDYPVIRPKNKA
jgi:hypothetical protein